MATANNKKPTPATKPVPAKPTAAAPKADVDDITEEPEAKDEFSKLPPAKRVAVRLGNEVNRLTKQADAIANWPTEATGAVQRAKERVTEALDALKSAASALVTLPDDYRPRVASAGKNNTKIELLPGSLVRITDKRVGEYEGILEPDQMRGIKVIEIRGNKVVATTKDGVKAMFARGHVCPDVG